MFDFDDWGEYGIDSLLYEKSQKELMSFRMLLIVEIFLIQIGINFQIVPTQCEFVERLKI